MDIRTAIVCTALVKSRCQLPWENCAYVLMEACFLTNSCTPHVHQHLSRMGCCFGPPAAPCSHGSSPPSSCSTELSTTVPGWWGAPPWSRPARAAPRSTMASASQSNSLNSTEWELGLVSRIPTNYTLIPFTKKPAPGVQAFGTQHASGVGGSTPHIQARWCTGYG